jgi:ribonuclease P protein component
VTDNRFPRNCRLRSSADFARVYERNAYAADSTLVVQGCRNQTDTARIGLSVSRRVGNAVVRNRWKRLVREAFRLNRTRLPRGIDLVVRPRKGAQPEFERINRSLVELAWRVERRLRKSVS